MESTENVRGLDVSRGCFLTIEDDLEPLLRSVMIGIGFGMSSPCFLLISMTIGSSTGLVGLVRIVIGTAGFEFFCTVEGTEIGNNPRGIFTFVSLVLLSRSGRHD